MVSLNVTLPEMHHGQTEVAEHPARFKCLSAGRRWRKSSLGVIMCLATALKQGFAWWVGPSYPVAAVGWRMLKRLTKQIPGCECREVDRMITLPGGGFIQVKSADNPDSLRGEGLDFVVLDECAFMREAAWTEALRPALSDKKGKALFISTPKGRNWFWQLWLAGKDPENTEWESWQFPTSSNPYIDAKEIEAARRGLPEKVFLQEYLAEFVEDAGSVFRRVMDAAVCEPSDQQIGIQSTIFGVDWGKVNDFTVITVMDALTKQQLYMDRFNQIDYAFQCKRLKVLADKYNPLTIIAEQNAMGDPIIEQLIRDGLPVQPFTTTNATKTSAIEALALAFEQEEIKILNDSVLINELQAFEAERLPSGLIRYRAPEGLHDDCVMSLALAWQGVISGSGEGHIDIAPSVAGAGEW